MWFLYGPRTRAQHALFISRARLVSALLTWVRAANQRGYDVGARPAHWVREGATPQRGCNYELAVVASCRVEEMPEATRLSMRLYY